jgi:hypothetical protein
MSGEICAELGVACFQCCSHPWSEFHARQCLGDELLLSPWRREANLKQ